MATAGEAYEFGLPGPPSGRHDGRELDLGSPLQRAVLVRLLLGDGRRCGLDQLVDALWEDPPGNAVRSVQTYVYRIRLSLGEERSRLETTRRGYRLDVPEQAVDALRFERLVRDGEELRAAGRTGPALRAFDAALALWSGEPLSGVPGPYAQRHRRRFTELRLNARVAQLECAGTPTGPGRCGARRPRPASAEQLPPAPGDFVGRERLRERLGLALRPGGEAVALAVLSGIGGVGKTALALRVAHGIRAGYPDGQLYVDLRGDGGSPADPADVLVGFLLALGMPAARIPAAPTARAGAYRTLTADRRILVVLDNASDTARVTQGRTAEAVAFFAESEAVAGSEDAPDSPACFHREVGRLFTALSSDRAEVSISAAQHVYEVSDRLRKERPSAEAAARRSEGAGPARPPYRPRFHAPSTVRRSVSGRVVRERTAVPPVRERTAVPPRTGD
ncbi:BTAD domain-containing putative transcriptional regulator [Streptomyces sp. 900105755]